MPSRERAGEREKVNERKKNKERRKMLTHLQAAENPGVNIREGEWHAAEKRGQHTGVSEHFAPGPMEKWCLRDKAEAYNPCQAPQGPLLQCLLSFYLAFPFLSCTASQPEQEVRDGDLESLLRSVLLWWICRFSATRSGSTSNPRRESFNCKVFTSKLHKQCANVHKYILGKLLQYISYLNVDVGSTLQFWFNNYKSV